MPSTYSNLGLELQATGENSNTWGELTNVNLQRIDNAIAGYSTVQCNSTTITLTFSTNVSSTTFTDENGRNKVLKFTSGTAGAPIVVTVPDVEKEYLVENTSGQAITFSAGGSTTYQLATGKTAHIYIDGASAVYNALDNFVASTIDSAVIGGTDPAAGTFTTLTANTSATISGDLTVDTDTLFVENATDTVFVGKTSNDINTVGSFFTSGGVVGLTRDGDHPLRLNRKSSSGSVIDFLQDGTRFGTIGGDSSDTDIFIASNNCGIRFNDDNNQIRPCDNAGSANDNVVTFGTPLKRFKDLYLSGNIYLGGTTSANALDDYEEGTWTPLIGGASGQSGQTYTRQAGHYTKIGRVVHCTFNVILSVEGTITGDIRLKNLPFTVGGTDRGFRSALNIGYWDVGTNYVYISGIAEYGQNYVTIYATGSSSSSLSAQSNTFTHNGTELIGQLTYFIA